MKKLSKILSLVIVACLAFALVACSPDIKGNYVFDDLSITVGGETYTASDIEALTEENDEFGLKEAAEAISYMKEIKFEVTADKLITEVDGQKQEASYKLDGDKIIMLDEEGEPEEEAGMSLTFKDGKIIMSGEGDEMSFKVTFKKA